MVSGDDQGRESLGESLWVFLVGGGSLEFLRGSLEIL